jgi:hypothetical protein
MFWIAFAAFGVCAIAESVTSWLFIRGSRERYPAHWQHAGSPTIMGNANLMSAWPLLRYVAQRRNAMMEEEAPVSFADRFRWPMVISYAAVLVSGMLLLAVAAIEMSAMGR